MVKVFTGSEFYFHITTLSACQIYFQSCLDTVIKMRSNSSRLLLTVRLAHNPTWQGNVKSENRIRRVSEEDTCWEDHSGPSELVEL